MIEPHGGKLIESYLEREEEEFYRERLSDLKKLTLDEVELSDLEMLTNGAFSPLGGFIGKNDYHSIITGNRLSSGLVWTIPIVLSVPPEETGKYLERDEVVLKSAAGDFLGILYVEEIYKRNLEREALTVFGTLDRNHPGVNYLFTKSPVLLGGKIKGVRKKKAPDYRKYDFTPKEMRNHFAERGWRTVVAFQTRNPIHRAHEYLQKVALEMVDGLLIHPLIGFTQPGDIPALVRMRCYEAIIEKYFPRERVVLGVFPAAMRYAGPKEAVFHALVRKNYGCTHFIVGRDHAGVGNFYGTYEAQNVFDQFTASEIGISIMRFENTFYCKRCDNLASAKTCPHQGDDQVFLSGTKVREMLRKGNPLPEEFTRPEVSEILMNYYKFLEVSL